MSAFRPREIFDALNRHGVDYVTIGGFAVAAHGSPRGTFDVDIVVAPEHANYERLAAAVTALGVSETVVDSAFRELDPRDPVDLARAANVRLETGAGSLDLLNRPAGAPDYGELRARALHVTVGDLDVPVVDLDTLIRLKRAAGRDRDLTDIADLNRLEM